MMLNVDLEKNKLLRVSGPASIRVKKGKVKVLGATFSEGERFVINRYRSYVIKGLEDKSLLEISLGDGGGIEEPAPGEEVVDIWETSVNEILTKCKSTYRKCTVMIVGPVESGKSSLTAFISNMALEYGLKPVIIDADIGQADIGPPGFISAAIPNKKILWLRDLSAEILRMIGSITPSHVLHRIIPSIIELTSLLRNRGDIVIIDTDGWVHGVQAIEYKIDMVRSVKPNYVIILGDKDLAETFKKTFLNTSINILYLPSPQVVKRRNRDDRRYLRSRAYQRYLENGKIRKFNLNDIALINTYIFTGERIDTSEIKDLTQQVGVTPLYASKHINTLFVVIDKQTNIKSIIELLSQKYGDVEIYVFVKGFEKGLLVSLLDANLEDKAPGIVHAIDFTKNEIYVQTRYEGEVRGIAFSKIRLSETWEEVGKPSKYMI